MMIILLAVTQHCALVIYVQQITAVGERFGLFPLLPDNWGFDLDGERENINTWKQGKNKQSIVELHYN